MIIQCDHCSAKFRMDDSKLANGPVKVRCAKCKEVFVVRKEEEADESFQSPADFGVAASSPAPSGIDREHGGGTPSEGSGGADEFSFNMDEPSPPAAAGFQAASGTEFGSSDEFDWKQSDSGIGAGASDEFNMEDFSAAGIPQEGSPSGESMPGEFDFGDLPQTDSFAASQTVLPGGTPPASDDFAIDFGEISFSDKPADKEPESFDFSFTPDEPLTETTQETTPESFLSSASSAGDFELSFDVEPQEKGAAPAVEEPAADAAPFGDFDFGDVGEQEAVKQAAPPAPKVSAFAGLPVTEEESVAEPDLSDLPPSSLTSRKKRGSLFPVLVIIGAILLIVALAGSGVYFFGGPKAFSKVGLGFLVEWYGQTGGEEGDIVLRNVKAEYVASKESGELFVVRGEALNNYKKPRASIQVKVALLGQGGASLKTKTAFCGNPLSNEQLISLPMAKIEEAMNNQFGDSLANLGVKPGNAIPFVVVVSEIPKEAVDYSVQVGGSTVATQ